MVVDEPVREAVGRVPRADAPAGAAVNVVDGRARGFVGSRYATYRFPTRFVEDHWNTVYANGSSEVFTR